MTAAPLVLSPLERQAARRIALYGLADLLDAMRMPPGLRTGPAPSGDAEELLEVLAAVDGAPGTPWARVDRRGVGPRTLATLESVACLARDAASSAARQDVAAGEGTPDPDHLTLRDDARIVRDVCARLSAAAR